jgi:hypothetical protein
MYYKLRVENALRVLTFLAGLIIIIIFVFWLISKNPSPTIPILFIGIISMFVGLILMTSGIVGGIMKFFFDIFEFFFERIDE